MSARPTSHGVVSNARVARLASATLAAALCGLSPGAAQAFDTVPAPASADVLQPRPDPSVAWLLAQLLPSPEIAAGSQGAAWGLRWQLTPIAYSWGVYRKITPWRFGLVDATARQSGSIELYASPEYVYFPTHDLGAHLDHTRFPLPKLAGGGGSWTGDALFLRYGTRAYFPLWEKGEFLSGSLGASLYDFAGTWGVAYEAGIYGLGGLAGFQLAVTPRGGPLNVMSTFVLRIF